MADSPIPTPLARYVVAARDVDDPAQRAGQWAINALLIARRDLAAQVRGSEFDPYADDSRLELFFEWVENNWPPRPERQRPVAHVSADSLVIELEHLYETAPVPEAIHWDFTWEVVHRLYRALDEAAHVREASVALLESVFGTQTLSTDEAQARGRDSDLRAMLRLCRALEAAGVDRDALDRAVADTHGGRHPRCPTVVDRLTDR